MMLVFSDAPEASVKGCALAQAARVTTAAQIATCHLAMMPTCNHVVRLAHREGMLHGRMPAPYYGDRSFNRYIEVKSSFMHLTSRCAPSAGMRQLHLRRHLDI